MLNAAVGVSAGVEALTSAFPALYPDRVVLCLVVLALITAANLWGVAESARLFIAPTVAFIVAIAAVIIGGLVSSHPAVPVAHNLPQVAESVGVLLLLRAFASGCSALTGVEAIANAVPSFRQPRARRAQHTEMWLGIILGAMLIGLALCIRKFDVTPAPTADRAGPADRRPRSGTTSPSTRSSCSPRCCSRWPPTPPSAACRCWPPCWPGTTTCRTCSSLRADRQVHRYGVVVLAVVAALLLVASRGDTQALVPLFAIGVFVGFTLSQAGMVRHWRAERSPGWAGQGDSLTGSARYSPPPRWPSS